MRHTNLLALNIFAKFFLFGTIDDVRKTMLENVAFEESSFFIKLVNLQGNLFGCVGRLD